MRKGSPAGGRLCSNGDGELVSQSFKVLLNHCEMCNVGCMDDKGKGGVAIINKRRLRWKQTVWNAEQMV